MKLSTNGQKLRKQFVGELSKEYVNTYFFAVIEGCDTSFFPTQLPVQRKDLINEDVSWVADWLKLWPKQSVTGLKYSISGQLPECKTRMGKLMKQIEDYGLQDITPEKITIATKAYLASQAEIEWFRTKKAHKFILDSDGSVLTDWLQSEAPVKKQFYL